MGRVRFGGSARNYRSYGWPRSLPISRKNAGNVAAGSRASSTGRGGRSKVRLKSGAFLEEAKKRRNS